MARVKAVPRMVELSLERDEEGNVVLPRGQTIYDAIVQAQGGVWNVDTGTLETEGGVAVAEQPAVEAEETVEKKPRPAPGTGKSYEKDPGRFYYELGYSHAKRKKPAQAPDGISEEFAARYQAGFDRRTAVDAGTAQELKEKAQAARDAKREQEKADRKAAREAKAADKRAAKAEAAPAEAAEEE
jgi:hypothetical protein